MEEFYLLLGSFSDAYLSIGVLLHSRFGSRAASSEQWPLQANNDRVSHIESFISLSVGHTSPYHSNRLLSLCIWQFSTCHVEIKIRKFKVLHVLAGRYWRVCSTDWLLSDEPFKDSIFSWDRFQMPTIPLAFFYSPDLVHVLLQANNDRVSVQALLQANNDRVSYIESFISLSVGHTSPYHSNCLLSLCIKHAAKPMDCQWVL
jgi:hypothetical protein